MVVEEPQVQPPDEWASLCERFSLHQSEEWLQAIRRTSVSHNRPSCTMRNATVKRWNMLQWSGEICCSEVVKYATMKWWNMLQWSGEICYSEVVKYASKWWNMLQWSGEICCSEVVKYATVKWWNMLMSCMETTCNVGFIYRAFHNVLCYYKHL